MAETCGRPNPFPDLPACQREPHEGGNHRAVWEEYGGTSSMAWRDAETIRELLAREAREAEAKAE